MKDKPILIAICGKSAAGKDTTARRLEFVLRMHKHAAALSVSDTTRPPRKREQDGVDYNFISKHEFLEKRANKKYLEWTTYKGWFYGTDRNQLSNHITIGVFDPKGLRQLAYEKDYTVVPVYLKKNLLRRLWHSYQREEKWQLEYIRRAWRDFKDFRCLDQYIFDNFSKQLVLKNYNPLEDSLFDDNKIYCYLKNIL